MVGSLSSSLRWPVAILVSVVMLLLAAPARADRIAEPPAAGAAAPVPPAPIAPAAPAPSADAVLTTTAPPAAPVLKKPKIQPLHKELLPIAILVLVIAFVVSRMPRIDVGHTAAYRRRRAMNWLPLGLTYAFLYMARYNLNVFKTAGGLSQADFGTIDGIGSMVYGVSFLLNGPLTDRWGGRATILIAAVGAAAANVAMGVMVADGHASATPGLILANAANMYFQSFGAVSIVKVNAGWFHLRERGTFGGIFGILISLGVYLGFDWNARILDVASAPWMFWVPSIMLLVFFAICYAIVHDQPSHAGFRDFDTADASSGDDGPRLPALTVIKRMLTNRVILMIAFVELSSGFLRHGILKWFPDFARSVGAGASFVASHWGMVSCIAGITGGMFAGLISDHVFHSRRLPVATVLYGIMLVGAGVILAFIGVPVAVSWVAAFMAMAIIGVHGMLSGTASQDFGGKKNAGIAVGIIDGFVYLGVAVQSFVYGSILPEKGTPAAQDASRWIGWPAAMIPVALFGLVLAGLLWNARPQARPKP